MNKRIIIFIVLCILILGGVAGTLFFFAQKQSTPVEDNSVGVKKVLDEQVISPIASVQNDSVWYFNKEGRLFEVNTDGSNLSEFALPSSSSKNLRRALWPTTGADFIIIGADGQKSFYDSQAKVFVKLAANVQFLDWLPDGKRIVYVWKASDGKSQQVALSDADGSGYKTIKPVFWPDLILKAGSDGKTVLMYRGDTQSTNKIYALNMNSGEITTLVDIGKNTAAAWLPVGDKFLFAQSSDDSTADQILLYDITNKKTSVLGLSTTLDRIAMDPSGNFIYAAVSKADNSGDTFVKLDFKSMKIETYFIPSGEVRVKNLILVGSSLYFTDSRDNKLYTIGK